MPVGPTSYKIIRNSTRRVIYSAPAIEHQRLAYELQQAFVKTGFDAVFSDLEAYCLGEQRLHGISNKRMMEAARVNPDVWTDIIFMHSLLTIGFWVLEFWTCGGIPQ